MKLFRDDWKNIFNGRRNVLTNDPKPIFGTIEKRFVIEDNGWVEIIKMSSGVVYYNIEPYHCNPLLFTDNPKSHGWNYLHKKFLTQSNNCVLMSDVQERALSYMINRHLIGVKYLTKQNRFKDLSIEVSDFVNNYFYELRTLGVDISQIEKELK